VGVALVGQIFFASLGDIGTLFKSGPSAVHAAFSDSAAVSTWYQIVSFGLVILLVFLLKARGPAQGHGSAPATSAPPVPMEA